MHVRLGVLVLALLGACDSASDLAVTPIEEGPPDATLSGDAGLEASPPTDAGADVGPAAPTLSQAGLYQDIAAKVVAAGAVEFSPAHPLWSDGSVKRRWIVLPAGAVIDTSNMDHWQFPVGTKFFKEFAFAGKRVETRIIERLATTGQIGTDYRFGAFVWRSDESDADFRPDGLPDALADAGGIRHDVPSQAQCNACHGSEPGFILGFSAVQLSKGGAAPTFKSLAAAGTFSVLPDAGADAGADAGDAGIDFPVPGNAVTAAALGALHANCGHCHQPAGFAFDETKMVLRLTVADARAATPGPVTSMVNVGLDKWLHPTIKTRVVPKNPAASAVFHRMNQRGTVEQMPPLATRLTDDAGAAAVSAWIMSL